MKDNWDLTELNGLVVAERRPLSPREKLDMREAKIIDAEYRLRRERELLAESQAAIAEEWMTIKATQDETTDRDKKSRALHNWARAFFLLGLFWFFLMTLQAMGRLP